MYAPFSALHPSSSHLTNTTETSNITSATTAATESTSTMDDASENGYDECKREENEGSLEEDYDYVTVDDADATGQATPLLGEQQQNEQSNAIQTTDSDNSTTDLTNMKAANINPSSHHAISELDSKMPAKQEEAPPPKSKPPHKINKDSRFLCSICLETVSDEPVVTRCGHLYCWTCLYQWLEPGMLLSEYTAAFGPTSRSHTNNSRGSGLNFLNDYSNVNINHRPYNPSGGRYVEGRRCCPVCKADCTVDSVIPVYIHHSLGGVGSMDDGASMPSVAAAAASTSGENHSLERELRTPRGSPTSLDGACSSFETDPTSNVGLRQRRRGRASSPQPTTLPMSAEPMFDSPVLESSHPGSNNTSGALNDTPIHRNGSQISTNREERLQSNEPSQVPSRPIPTSPWVTNRTLRPPSNSTPQHPNVQEQTQPNNDTTIGTSSPFRMALRPRRQHPPFLSSSHNNFNSHHHAGLTSVLMGIVDTIDNYAASHASRNNETPSGNNRTVPQLHRSDGGIGGIGRVSERQMNQDESVQSEVMNEEESSLEMAREFLSRLLLMLACFVVLCLLLF